MTVCRKWGLMGVIVGSLALIITSQGVSQPGAPGGAAPPGNASGRRVAVIDVVRIFNECAQIKDLNEKMRLAGDQFAAEAKRRRELLDQRTLELRAFRPGTVDYENRRKELVKINIEANSWAKATEEDLERQKFDWTRIIYGKTIEAATQIAKDQGYDLVLQTAEFKPMELPEQDVQSLRRIIQQRAVIYNVAEVDVTDPVILRLDAEYKASLQRAPTSTAPAGQGP